MKGDLENICLLLDQVKELQEENKELKQALHEYVQSVLAPDHVQKWYNQYKDDETANRVLINAIAVLNRINTK